MPKPKITDEEQRTHKRAAYRARREALGLPPRVRGTTRKHKRKRVNGIPLSAFEIQFRRLLLNEEMKQAAREARTQINDFEHLLAGDNLPPLAPLATRDQFPDAAQWLARTIRARRDLISIMSEPALARTTLLWRLAWNFGAVKVTSSNLYLEFDPESLRDSPAGRVALCAAGEPPASWTKLSRRERAAFALHLLVTERRRASS